jgi:two-component system, NarL family, nitrate/nitrite response regulator NarL
MECQPHFDVNFRPDGSGMNSSHTAANPFISICSRSPIVIWAISELLTKRSFHWGVVKLLTRSLPVTSHGPQIVLVDVSSIPEWPELVARWTSAECRTILLMAERWDFVRAELRALRLGVSGIVRIAQKFGEQLGDAIAMVAAGHIYVKDEALYICRSEFPLRDCRSRVANLSFREEQVLDLVILGFTNRRIGMMLGIRERTAKFHVCNILHKLNVKRRKDVFGMDRDFLEGVRPHDDTQIARQSLHDGQGSKQFCDKTKGYPDQHIGESNVGLHPVRIGTG